MPLLTCRECDSLDESLFPARWRRKYREALFLAILADPSPVYSMLMDAHMVVSINRTSRLRTIWKRWFWPLRQLSELANHFTKLWKRLLVQERLQSC